jgi:hypothetical protein
MGNLDPDTHTHIGTDTQTQTQIRRERDLQDEEEEACDRREAGRQFVQLCLLSLSGLCQLHKLVV